MRAVRLSAPVYPSGRMIVALSTYFDAPESPVVTLKVTELKGRLGKNLAVYDYKDALQAFSDAQSD